MSAEFMTAVAMAEAVATGAATSEALTRKALARLDKVGRELNAVVTLTPDAALEQARAVDKARAMGRPLGPLAGVPMAHKDLFYRAGRPAPSGSKIRSDFTPDVTATVLQRLDVAGAVDLGTLHMAEFALSPTGYNEHYGHGRNPWNPDHVCGGSSSGSAVAVAARCVPAALGTDTGGSIRHPASACGLVGLKPTHGGVSLAGGMPLSATLDSVGPLTLTARDAARILDVIAGEDRADPTTAWAPKLAHEAALSGDMAGVTVAVPETYYGDEVHPEIADLLDEARRALEERGARILRTRVPDMEVINAYAHLVMAVEASTLHRNWLIDRADDYAGQVRGRIEPGLFYPAQRYVEALMLRGRIAAEWIGSVIGEADMAMLPAFPMPVPTIAETTSGSPADVAAVIGRLTRNTRGVNYLGLPAVAVPMGFAQNGLPAAFQLVGRPWSEPALLRAADAYQRVTSWHTRVPSISEFQS